MLQLSTFTMVCLSLCTESQFIEMVAKKYQNRHQEDTSVDHNMEKAYKFGLFRRNPGFVAYDVNPFAQLHKYRRPLNIVPLDYDQIYSDYMYSSSSARAPDDLTSSSTFGDVGKREYTIAKRWYLRSAGKKKPISRYQLRKFPYANIVKLSSGCTGTLLTPYHVITAAHCVHDGINFKENIEMLKVQVPDKYGYRVHYIVKINVPVMWIKAEVIPEYAYDYAVLQLNLPVTGRDKFMQLALPTIRTKYSDLHFFGFFPNEVNGLWESTCAAEKSRFVYGGNAVLTECESAVGNSGAAVFAENAVDGDKIIGILSSTLSQPDDNDFEAIMLLTLSKCLDICAMIYPAGEKYDVCKEVKRREMSYFRVGTNRIMPFFG